MRFFKWWGALPPWRLASGALSGVLLTLAFPDIGLEWLAWGGLVPLFFAVRCLPVGQSFGIGFVAGFVHYLSLLYWLLPTLSRYGELPLVVAGVLFLGLVLALSVYVGTFAMMPAAWLDRPVIGALAVPCGWVALEYARTFLFSGLPWELLGYSQFENLPLIQVADITGVYGLSFLVAFGNVIVFYLLQVVIPIKGSGDQIEKRWAAGLLAGFLILLGATWGYGKYRLTVVENLLADAPTMKMTVVQGNIDQAQKWAPAYRLSSVEKYMALASQEMPRSPQLVILPETAMPFYFIYDEALTRMVQDKARDMGSYILAGAPSFSGTVDHFTFYNSAYLVSPVGKILDRYDKAHLVPFGEYLPGGDWLPYLEKIVYGAGDFSPGEPGKLLHLDDWRLGVQICYEAIFPGGCRQLVSNGADVLVNITNDAWYGKTSAPYQHFSMTVMRAVETRRSLVRSANTGISGLVYPSGQIKAQTALFTDAVETYQVPRLNILSVYTRAGDLFAKICVIFIIFMLWQGYRRKKA